MRLLFNICIDHKQLLFSKLKIKVSTLKYFWKKNVVKDKII